jgi:predicted metal-dependent hydrolase
VDGVSLTVVVERKRVKNVNARMSGSTLHVSAPPSMPQATLENIIVELARRLLRRVRATQVNSSDNALVLARRIAQRFPRPPRIERVEFVTTQRARWGSYSARTHTIRLSAALRHMPRWVLEAVVAHELGHVFHHDHSAAFWALVRAADPDTDRANAFLNGVSWLAARWPSLPAVERKQLIFEPVDANAPDLPAPVDPETRPPLEAWFAREEEEGRASGDGRRE